MIKKIIPEKFIELSKSVGWDSDIIIKYPTLEEVNNFDNYELLLNYRFLKSPETDNEKIIMDRLVELFKQMRG